MVYIFLVFKQEDLHDIPVLCGRSHWWYQLVHCCCNHGLYLSCLQAGGPSWHSIFALDLMQHRINEFSNVLCVHMWQLVWPPVVPLCLHLYLKVTTFKSTTVPLGCTRLIRHPMTVVCRRTFSCSSYLYSFVKKTLNLIVYHISVFNCQQREQQCVIWARRADVRLECVQVYILDCPITISVLGLIFVPHLDLTCYPRMVRDALRRDSNVGDSKIDNIIPGNNKIEYIRLYWHEHAALSYKTGEHHANDHQALHHRCQDSSNHR